MIGNDIVDLAKAKEESNIFRPRYLQKVCNTPEVDLILSSGNPIHTFWRIWTMKESAYKAFQRQFKFESVFNPFAFRCEFNDDERGEVIYQDQKVSISSMQTNDFIYSEVISKELKNRYFGTAYNFLEKLKMQFNLQSLPRFSKSKENFPELNLFLQTIPVSITHHGKFQVFQYYINLKK